MISKITNRKMKFYLIMLITIAVNKISAQSYDDVHFYSGSNNYVSKATLDSNDNIVTLEEESGQLKIKKYNNSGNFLWSKDISGFLNTMYYVNSDIQNHNDDVYIVSSNNSIIKSDISTSTGMTTFWETLTSSNELYIRDIKVKNDHIYIVGNFETDVSFDGGSTSLSSPAQGSFIAKYSISPKALVWAKVIDVAQAKHIDVDNGGNVFISGEFNNTATFYSATSSHQKLSTGGTNKDTFMAKFDDNGNFDNNYGVKVVNYNAASFSQSLDLLVDDLNGVVYWSKKESSTPGLQTLLSHDKNFPGNLNWDKTISQSLTRAIGVNSCGRLYITGQKYNPSSTITGGTCGHDFFAQVIDPTNGNTITASESIGCISFATDIVIDSNNKVFFIGNFKNAIDIDSTYSSTDKGTFLAIFNDNVSSDCCDESLDLGPDVEVCPDELPNLDISDFVDINANITWYLDTRIVQYGGTTYEVLQPGNYSVQVIFDNECLVTDEISISLIEYSQPDFHFESADGIEQSNFCFGEEVILNGSATSPTPTNFYLDIWSVNPDGSANWLEGLGWISGAPDLINLTDLFGSHPGGVDNFDPGVIYRIKLAIDTPECGWSETTQDFTITLCPSLSCEDFNDIDPSEEYIASTTCTTLEDQVDNWGVVNLDQLYYSDDHTDGSGDYYLYLNDGACPDFESVAFNSTEYSGNWTYDEALSCFCFDLNLIDFTPGPAGSSPGGNVLQIMNGSDPQSSSVRATFVLNSSLEFDDGWTRICAPINLLDSSGNLPSNATGQWTMTEGNAADWDSLITNVGAVGFVADVNNGDEEIGIDNICFSDECCDVSVLPDFHFQGNNYNELTSFCIGEEIYLNGSATSPTPTSYYLDIWVVNPGGTINWLASQGDSAVTNGWATGSPDLINLSDLFGSDPDGAIIFQAGVTYRVKLAIDVDGCGWSETTHDFTMVNCFTDPCEEMEAPSDLRVIDEMFMWNGVENAMGYYVTGIRDRETGCECLNEQTYFESIRTRETSLRIPQGIRTNCFVWQVTSVCEDGSRVNSELACYEGILKKQIKVKIKPNPTRGRFEIHLENEIEGDIRITNMFGRTVFTSEIQGSTIEGDISDEREGVYIVNIYSTNEEILYRGQLIKH